MSVRCNSTNVYLIVIQGIALEIGKRSGITPDDSKNTVNPAKELYKIYEYADGLYFPDMRFRCGSLDNYVRTGVLTAEEAEELWNENVSLK